jgi:hypothetical protein
MKQQEVSMDEARLMRTQASGERPILRLPVERVSKPETDAISRGLARQLSGRVVQSWSKGRRVPVSTRDVLEAATTPGHDIWLTGGLVREALRSHGGSDGGIGLKGDLDLTGSIPPGTFSARLREFAGRAELPRRLNPTNGVVAVWGDPSRKERLFEYAPLRERWRQGDAGLRYGCDLEADASWRDLTMNALCYDWRHDYVLDPTGRGVDDARGLRLRPPGPPPDRAGFLTRCLFRFFKFMRRWPHAETRGLGEFVRKHFDEIEQDMKTVDPVELIHLAQPYGSSPEQRREALVALGLSIAPSCNWQILFDGLGASP